MDVLDSAFGTVSHYDALGRLADARSDGPMTDQQAFTYDALGNMQRLNTTAPTTKAIDLRYLGT